MSESGAPAVTVVVITYNSAHVVGELLDSLPAAVDHVAVETIVVDNGSADGTADLVEARGDCVVVRGSNVGYAAGINRGYAEGRGTGPILILNPDVRLQPGSVTRMVEALQRPRAGIIAPRVLNSDGSLQFSLRREPTLPRALGLTFTRIPVLSEYCNDPNAYRSAHVVDWALGAVLLVRRECFAALHGWDASYFLYSEETDFCLRARALGWDTWYEPAAVVEHAGRESGYNKDIHAMQIVNRIRFFRRRHGVVSSTIYWMLAICSEGYRALLGSRIHQHSVLALVKPSSRPPEIGCSHQLLPR